LRQIRGSTPSLLRLGPGCAFRDRCDRATDECAKMPPLAEHEGRAVRCVHPLELA
jgi:peptide/nickel transport system ATP-binding protein